MAGFDIVFSKTRRDKKPYIAKVKSGSTAQARGSFPSIAVYNLILQLIKEANSNPISIQSIGLDMRSVSPEVGPTENSFTEGAPSGEEKVFEKEIGGHKIVMYQTNPHQKTI